MTRHWNVLGHTIQAMLIQSYAFCASVRPPRQRPCQCFHCKLEIEFINEPESQAKSFKRAYPFQCRAVPAAAHSVLAHTRSWKYKVSDSRWTEAWEKWQMVGRSCTPAAGILCSHNQPLGGLTWHGSEHTEVRIYSGKERGKKITDVVSLYSTSPPQVLSIAPFCPPWPAWDLRCGRMGQ